LDGLRILVEKCASNLVQRMWDWMVCDKPM